MKPPLLTRVLFPQPHFEPHFLRHVVRGKTVVITGASFGIGEQMALLLAPHEPHLVMIARTREKLEALQERLCRLGAQVSVIVADLYVASEVERVILELQALPFGVDFFVSNAGKSIMRPLAQSLHRLHDVRRTLHLNFLSPVQMLLALAPMLAQNQGHIIHVSAVNVLLQPAPYWAAYQASKTAMEQWARCNQAEFYAMGIRTSIVYLPLVRTRMIAPSAFYQNSPCMSAEQAAMVVLRLFYTKKTSFKPWWLGMAMTVSFFSRGVWELAWRWRLTRVASQKK